MYHGSATLHHSLKLEIDFLRKEKFLLKTPPCTIVPHYIHKIKSHETVHKFIMYEYSRHGLCNDLKEKVWIATKTI